MPGKILLIVIFVFITLSASSQENFYHKDSIRDIRIEFSQDNWDQILDSLYVAGDKQRMLATLFIDGYKYDSVGVRYKGYSSASIDRVKNPFNIKLNYSIPGQRHLGVDKIKLSNVIQDPSFLREVLSYDIARKYMPASKANFANVFVNDTLLGLYTNVEAVNNEFLDQYFRSSEHVFVKGNPETVDLYGENSNLSHNQGADSSSYYSLYSMESDYGWAEHYNFIDSLNNYPESTERILNVDRALWMHALNYTLVNFDSYVGYAQNYYLYMDEEHRFNPILWDLNMSFGSFRLTDASTYFDGFSIQQAKELDPLTHYNEFSVFPRPLMRNLFNTKRHRLMYMAHIRTIVEENFANSWYKESIENYKSLITDMVFADPNKFYSNNAFLLNSDTTVSDLIDYPGIIDLMDARSLYLSEYSGYKGSPHIDSISHSPYHPSISQQINISAYAQAAGEVLLYYRSYPQLSFNQLMMTPSQDQSNIFTANIPFQGTDLDYYVYAENDSAAAFYPKRAAYEYSTIEGMLNPGDIVINEIMADNSSSAMDDNSEYEDWIELYNNNSNSISLNGLYLSDELEHLMKWPLPNQTLNPDSYIVIWADSDEGPLHANFKLSSLGEQLYLTDQNGLVLDSVIFEQQIEDVSYGRIPNGQGEFMLITPTLASTNDQSKLIPNSSELLVDLYPNPANHTLNLKLESQLEVEMYLFDMKGEILLQTTIERGISDLEIPITHLSNGIYALSLRTKERLYNKKIVKL